VLDAMLGPGVRRAERTGPELSPEQLLALEAIEAGEETCDAVATRLDLSGAEVAAALATLEALGYVTCSLVGSYSRSLLQPPGGERS
jgi:DNA-binding MarR family transcriptional regulator